MKTYTVSVIISSIFVVIGNLIYSIGATDLTFLEIVIATALAVMLMLAIDALVATMLHEFPKLFFKNFMTQTKFYNANRFPFKVYKKEKFFYEKIGVKKWKDLLPNKMGMRKDHLEDKNDTNYLSMFIIESCRAEFMHLVSAIVTILPLILIPFRYFGIILPVSIVNISLQILPIIVQRYNRPKLMIVQKRALRQAVKTEEEIETTSLVG